MKKGITGILICVMLFLLMLTGCKKENTAAITDDKEVVTKKEQDISETKDNEKQTEKEDTENVTKLDPMDELLQDAYKNHKEKGGEIAFVLSGTVEDGSYNEDIYKGIQVYALSAGVSFSNYAVEATESDAFEKIMENAIVDGAKIIVCGGYTFGEAVAVLQERYPDVAFLLIDGVLVDENGETATMTPNVHCVSFKEEESGYLAGYLSVIEGYRNLAFIGGESVPSVINYGHGYLQGIDEAAKAIDAEDITVNYWYAETFEPNDAISQKASDWYRNGTEIIFACGGAIYESVLEAADKEDGMLIGVDVDQSGISKRILTSAIKDTAKAVIVALDDFYAAGMKWPKEHAGCELEYTIEDNCTGIPVMNTEWRFEEVTTEEVYELYRKIKEDEISISNQTDKIPKVSFTLNLEEAGE